MIMELFYALQRGTFPILKFGADVRYACIVLDADYVVHIYDIRYNVRVIERN